MTLPADILAAQGIAPGLGSRSLRRATPAAPPSPQARTSTSASGSRRPRLREPAAPPASRGERALPRSNRTHRPPAPFDWLARAERRGQQAPAPACQYCACALAACRRRAVASGSLARRLGDGDGSGAQSRWRGPRGVGGGGELRGAVEAEAALRTTERACSRTFLRPPAAR